MPNKVNTNTKAAVKKIEVTIKNADKKRKIDQISKSA